VTRAFVENERVPAERIADVVQTISEAVTQSEIDRVIYVSSNWL
jgi:hypothetical protein